MQIKIFEMHLLIFKNKRQPADEIFYFLKNTHFQSSSYRLSKLFRVFNLLGKEKKTRLYKLYLIEVEDFLVCFA